MRARIALAAAALAAGLLLVEGVLRFLGLPRFDACLEIASYAVPDPELGFRGDPSRPVAGVVPNALGLRGPMPARPKPDDECRILFLGDSTCWGLGVDLEQSFGARATALLDASLPGRHATFLLGAFPAYSSYQSAILLERLLPESPDIAVLYLGARNDGDRAHYYPDAEIPARHARLNAAWHRSHLLRALEAAIDRGYHGLFQKLRTREARARVPPPAFRANLERITTRLEDAGIPAFVVLPPISPIFEAHAPQVRVYREILIEVASRRALPIVSLDERFASDESGALFFDDQFHLAPRGHAIVAEALHAAMLREGSRLEVPTSCASAARPLPDVPARQTDRPLRGDGPSWSALEPPK